jgi:hypothetical protein
VPEQPIAVSYHVWANRHSVVAVNPLTQPREGEHETGALNGLHNYAAVL